MLAWASKKLGRELPGRAAFGKVWLEGRREPLTEGTAYVNFFPGGRAQKAVVPIVDGDNLYSIVLEPMTGAPRAKRPAHGTAGKVRRICCRPR